MKVLVAPEHLRMAASAAREAARKWPFRGVNLDDYEAAALGGLYEAAERFDPARGVKFATFAYRRIRGATSDLARQIAPFKRTDRSNRQVFSLEDERPTRRPDETVLLRELVPSSERGPWELLEARDEVERALEALAPRDREIVRRYHLGGETLAEIGESLGITASRVCQIRSRALAKLRAREKKSGEVAAPNGLQKEESDEHDRQESSHHHQASRRVLRDASSPRRE